MIEERKFSFSLGNYNLLLVKSRDVPIILEKYPEKALLGITGKDWFEEYLLKKGYKTNLEVLKEFTSSAKAKICALTKKDFNLEKYEDLRLRIVTPYPNLSEKWIREKGIESFEIENAVGETEGWVTAGFADIAIDNVSSGKTSKANNLKIFEEILRSYAVVISNKESSSQTKMLFGE